MVVSSCNFCHIPQWCCMKLNCVLLVLDTSHKVSTPLLTIMCIHLPFLTISDNYTVQHSTTIKNSFQPLSIIIKHHRPSLAILKPCYYNYWPLSTLSPFWLDLHLHHQLSLASPRVGCLKILETSSTASSPSRWKYHFQQGWSSSSLLAVHCGAVGLHPR